jgi:hypothetical protein
MTGELFNAFANGFMGGIVFCVIAGILAASCYHNGVATGRKIEREKNGAEAPDEA